MKRFLIGLSIIFSIIGVFLLFYFFYLLVKNEYDIHSLSNTLMEKLIESPGDFVGGIVGVFFTIVGSLLLFITLKYQRDEFRETQLTLAKQQFETTFFNMLSMLTEIRNSMSGDFIEENGEVRTFVSQSFIGHFLDFLQRKYQKYIVDYDLDGRIEAYLQKVDANEDINQIEQSCLNEEINKIYEGCYKQYQSQLGHYFRYIYNLIKFTIDNREGFKDDKKYIDLIQAQLSNDELALLFYNANSSKGMNSEGIYQFKLWLENYQFLENLDEQSLLCRAHHILYVKTKFKFLNRDEVHRKSNN